MDQAKESCRGLFRIRFVEAEFARQSGRFLPKPHGSAGSSLRRCVSNPLLGGEEAEGFGVGIHDREPTPALR
jgi:hypothetical protein